jgi:hypothetical protein
MRNVYAGTSSELSNNGDVHREGMELPPVGRFKKAEQRTVIVPLEATACSKELFLGGDMYGAGAKGQVRFCPPA